MSTVFAFIGIIAFSWVSGKYIVGDVNSSEERAITKEVIEDFKMFKRIG